MSSFTASMVTLLEVLKKIQVRVWGWFCFEDCYINHFIVMTWELGCCPPGSEAGDTEHFRDRRTLQGLQVQSSPYTNDKKHWWLKQGPEKVRNMPKTAQHVCGRWKSRPQAPWFWRSFWQPLRQPRGDIPPQKPQLASPLCWHFCGSDFESCLLWPWLWKGKYCYQ